MFIYYEKRKKRVLFRQPELATASHTFITPYIEKPVFKSASQKHEEIWWETFHICWNITFSRTNKQPWVNKLITIK